MNKISKCIDAFGYKYDCIVIIENKYYGKALLWVLPNDKEYGCEFITEANMLHDYTVYDIDDEVGEMGLRFVNLTGDDKLKDKLSKLFNLEEKLDFLRSLKVFE